MRWILWGTGAYGQRIVAAMERLEEILPGVRARFFPLAGVVDRAARQQGRMLGGCRIGSPERMRRSMETAAILVAMQNPASVIEELRRWGISEKHIFTMQAFCRFFFCEICPAVAEQREQLGELSDAAEQLLAWLRAAGELVRGGMFSERYALDSGLPRADVAGILDLALSEREILQFYQTVSYGRSSRPLRTIAIHYLRFHNGGVERVMAEQIPMLQSLGLRVVLLLDAYEAASSYACPQDVPIVALGNKDDGWLSWYRRFQAACEKYDVDGVYCHRYLVDADLLPWLMRSEGRHFFVELHSVFTWWVQSRYELLRLLCRQAETVAVLSRVDARFWQLQGVRSVFLPNPVTVPERGQLQGEERKDVYWIGRLEQLQKKVYDVVPIMQRILKRQGGARLHLVGMTDHPEVLSELKRRIDEAGIASAIVFEGYHQDLCDIYRRARVCLMTSRFEGFPMVLTEALSHGVPVVMYDLPYLELVRQCQGIFSVPMGDTAAAAEAVSALLSDDALWQRSSTMAVDSLRAFVQRYPQKHLLRKFLFQNGELTETVEDEETLRILVDTLVDWQVHPCGG